MQGGSLPQHGFPLIVRAMPIDLRYEPIEVQSMDMTSAITIAWRLSKDERYRSVVVTDGSHSLWVQFNLTWSFYAWEREVARRERMHDEWRE